MSSLFKIMWAKYIFVQRPQVITFYLKQAKKVSGDKKLSNFRFLFFSDFKVVFKKQITKKIKAFSLKNVSISA